MVKSLTGTGSVHHSVNHISPRPAMRSDGPQLFTRIPSSHPFHPKLQAWETAPPVKKTEDLGGWRSMREGEQSSSDRRTDLPATLSLHGTWRKHCWYTPECFSSNAKAARNYVCVCVCLAMSHSLQPHRLQPPGICQERILEWVAISSSRGSSPPRDGTHFLLYLLHWQVDSFNIGITWESHMNYR